MQDIISCLIQMAFIGYWFGSILHLPMSINFVCGKFCKYRIVELWQVMAKIVEAFGWIKQWPGSAGSCQYGGKNHFVMHSMNFGPKHHCHLMQRRRRKWLRHLSPWLGYWKMSVRPSFASYSLWSMKVLRIKRMHCSGYSKARHFGEKIFQVGKNYDILFTEATLLYEFNNPVEAVGNP